MIWLLVDSVQWIVFIHDMRTFCQVKPKTFVKTNALCAMHYKCCNPSGCILYTWQVWLWNQHKFCSVGDISISVLVRTSMINCSISEIKTQAMKIAIIIVNLRVLSSKLMGRGIKGFYWEYFILLICQTLVRFPNCHKWQLGLQYP